MSFTYKISDPSNTRFEFRLYAIGKVLGGQTFHGRSFITPEQIYTSPPGGYLLPIFGTQGTNQLGTLHVVITLQLPQAPEAAAPSAPEQPKPEPPPRPPKPPKEPQEQPQQPIPETPMPSAPVPSDPMPTVPEAPQEPSLYPQVEPLPPQPQPQPQPQPPQQHYIYQDLIV